MQFVKLPSGLIVNLGMVQSVSSSERMDRPAFTLHFGTGDIVLDADDSAFLKGRLPVSSGLSSNVRVAAFWIVILVSMFLTWSAVHRLHSF